MRIKRAAVALLGLAITACGGDDDDGAEDATDMACLTVPDSLTASILDGHQDDTGDLTPVNTGAVEDSELGHFVAIEFTAVGVDNPTGVWAVTGTLDDPGLIISAEGVARNFTQWADGSTSDLAIDVTHPSVDAAKSCLD